MPTVSRRKLMVSSGAAALLQPFISAIEARAEGPALKPAFFTLFKGQCQYGGGGDTAANARNWLPTLEGDTLKLAPLLAPFEKVKQYMTFVIGLDINTSPTDWHWSMPTLFTGFNSRPKGPKTDPTNESVDWYVAKRSGAPEPLVMNVYGRFFKTVSSHVSFGRDANGTVFKKAPTYDPLALFGEVFGKDALPAAGGSLDAARQAALERTRRSMLDFVRADAAYIRARAAAAHRPQIDATLEGIRQLETELIGKNGKLSPEMTTRCMPAAAVEMGAEDVFGNEANFKRAMDGMVDVTLAALRCGLRNVFSFAFLDLDCQRFVPAKIRPEFRSLRHGVTPYHFEHTHFPNGAPYLQCEQYIHGFYARLLEGMAAIPAGTTNLLQRSLGLYATTMSHNHSSNCASYFYVGNAGGRLKSSRILRFGDPTRNAPSGRPHNDVLVSMLHAWGYEDVKTFGDPALCKGGLAGVI